MIIVLNGCRWILNWTKHGQVLVNVFHTYIDVGRKIRLDQASVHSRLSRAPLMLYPEVAYDGWVVSSLSPTQLDE